MRMRNYMKKKKNKDETEKESKNIDNEGERAN